jgi:hypothetical protein
VPGAVADAVAQYRQTYVFLTATPELREYYAKAPQEVRELFEQDAQANPPAKLSQRFMDVWYAMRNQLGTDPLSEQTLRLSGVPDIGHGQGDGDPPPPGFQRGVLDRGR